MSFAWKAARKDNKSPSFAASIHLARSDCFRSAWRVGGRPAQVAIGRPMPRSARPGETGIARRFVSLAPELVGVGAVERAQTVASSPPALEAQWRLARRRLVSQKNDANGGARGFNLLMVGDLLICLRLVGRARAANKLGLTLSSLARHPNPKLAPFASLSGAALLALAG